MHFVNMVGTGLSAIEQTANISPLANLEVHRPFVRPAVHCFAIFAAGVLLCGCTRASVQANGFGGTQTRGRISSKNLAAVHVILFQVSLMPMDRLGRLSTR